MVWGTGWWGRLTTYAKVLSGSIFPSFFWIEHEASSLITIKSLLSCLAIHVSRPEYLSPTFAIYGVGLSLVLYVVGMASNGKQRTFEYPSLIHS